MIPLAGIFQVYTVYRHMSGIYQVYTIIINFLGFPDHDGIMRMYPSYTSIYHAIPSYDGICEYMLGYQGVRIQVPDVPFKLIRKPETRRPGLFLRRPSPQAGGVRRPAGPVGTFRGPGPGVPPGLVTNFKFRCRQWPGHWQAPSQAAALRLSLES
jgi:hypothetical protein